MAMNYHGVCRQEEGGSGMVTQMAIQHNNFTMVPNILIDAYDEMSDACRFGYIKFMRLVRKDGYFAGSLRKLGKRLKVANMTIHRMVAAWAKFLLVRIELIEDTDAVRVIPLIDMLWNANTDHYQYAPAEVREPVTNCDTITVTDRTATDRVVTKRDALSQNVTQPVTNCDTVSQPQARNDPQYSTNIGNKREEDISLTLVSDSLPPYEEGYLEQATRALLEWTEEQMSTRYPPAVDNVASPPKQPSTPEVAVQSASTENDTLFPASIPISQEASK